MLQPNQRPDETLGAGHSHELPGGVVDQHERIKLRILVPLTVAIGILLTAFGLGIHGQQQRASARSLERSALEVQQLLASEQKKYTEIMTTTLHAILSDERLAEAFRGRQRQDMLERTRPLYESLRSLHEISHFYFHAPDRVNLLRVHRPEQAGDLINRYTALEAERTGQISSGIERGPIGTFVLRVVTPWRRDGQLLGYVELGVEFENIIERVRGLLDVDFVVAVDKRFLDREQWNKALKTYGKEGSWDQFPMAVVMNKTMETIPGPVQQYLLRPRDKEARLDGVVSWNGHLSQVVFLPLKDITGKQLGELIVLRDITAATAQESQAVLMIVLIVLSVSAPLIGFFYVFLERIERKLRDGTAKLRAEITTRQVAQEALGQAHTELEARVEQRTRELQETNGQLHREILRREQAQRELDVSHKQLVEASRLAGMAEVARNVLHNVGNLLNSVNVSVAIVSEKVGKSKSKNLGKVVLMLREHAAELGAFLTTDPRGKKVPVYLGMLVEHLDAEQSALLTELADLQVNIEHIKGVVAMQQTYARASGVTETVRVAELIEDMLRMNASSLAREDLRMVREFAEVPPIEVDKHNLMQILVGLVSNARYACDDSGREDKQLTLRVAGDAEHIRISVTDNGVGIPPENLTLIFNHGFTTRKDGHGFGLHSSANAAKEMGGALSVHSKGPGSGATFTLELPIRPPTGLGTVKRP